MSRPLPQQDLARTSPRRRALYRVGAILFGLGLLLLLEGSLRLLNWGRIADTGDPYVGFSDIVPLFEASKQGSIYEVTNSRLNWFQPEWFAAEKPPDEFRIFCLGGSTVQGRPYSIETSFTTWLELSLTAADDSRTWQVVNCGGVSYASYRLVPILQEVLDYAPDLVIVYTGHNEFLEDRSYGEIKNQARWITNLQERLIHWRIFGVAQQLLRRSPPVEPKTNLPSEVDAWLDYHGGLAHYHRNETWRAGVIDHYEHNLKRMVQIAKNAAVPLFFANPVSNLRDTPPFKSEVSPKLSSSEQRTFRAAWQQATEASWEDLGHKTSLVQQVLSLDEGYANAHFLLAKLYEAAEQDTAARRSYLRAKDCDVCPLRMLEPMHAALQHVTRQTGTPFVDVRRAFEQQAELGIPGNDQLVDHVHPSLDGHQRIADLLFQRMVEQRLVVPRPNWEQRRQELYRTNYATLPSNYFPDSQARLQGLLRWTQGRANELQLDPRAQPSDASK